MENFIKKLTKEAGDKLLTYFKEEKKLLSLREGSKEVVTKYDKEIDLFIVKKIEEEYPEHSILTEESGMKKRNSDYLWVVDSLDGSGNFANGNPIFSVCIALSFKNELIISSIYAPALEEFYFAQKEKGAFLNGKKINVSSVESMKRSYVMFCDGHEKNKKFLSKKLSSVYEKVIDLRKLGSAGVETGWLALGRIDGFLMFDGDSWDLAAGALIVKEAGGEVTDFKGNPWEIKRGSFIFSNSKIHQELEESVK